MADYIQKEYQIKRENVAHYDCHEQLDVDHARKLFLAAEFLDPFVPDLRFTPIVLRAIHIFRDVYNSIETFYEDVVPFSNVWEDCAIELSVAKKGDKALCIASGGCTAFSLSSKVDVVVAVDQNPAQIAHARKKLFCIMNGDIKDFLCKESGIYETIFALRRYDNYAELFNKKRLNAIFGKDATGDATTKDFCEIFSNAVDKARERDDHYARLLLHGCAGEPEYLKHRVASSIRFECENIIDHLGLYAKYDVISLSNVTDWMTPEQIACLVEGVHRCLETTGKVITRRMHGMNVTPFFQTKFRLVDGPHDRTHLYTTQVWEKL